MTWKNRGASTRAVALCLGAALLGPLLSQPAFAQTVASSQKNLTWAEAMSVAVDLSAISAGSLEGQARASARLEQANRRFPGVIEGDLSARQDAIGSGDGYRELEGGVSVSLWRQGERDRIRSLSATERSETDAVAAVARLALAGRLRTAYWAREDSVAQASAAQELLDQSAEALRVVERLEGAGEMSRLDLLTARAAHAQAQSLVASLEGQRAEAQARWTGLIGASNAAAQLPVEAPAAVPVERHPEIVLALAQSSVAGGAAQMSRLQAGGRWRVGLDARAERARNGDETGISTGVRISRPLGQDRSEQGNARGLEARATASRARAQSLGPQIEAGRAEAAAQLAAARATLLHVEARTTASREAMTLVMRGRAGGELSFLEGSRARASLGEAERALASARVAISAAISNFNQAQGQEPGVITQ